MHTFDVIKQFIQKEALIKERSTVIVGLSGGPDSVFLLHFLHHFKQSHDIHLIAATLDHGWRAESKDEVLFCRQLCTSLNIPFFHAHADEIGITKKGSREEIARFKRRAFFESIAAKNENPLIALGHHQDDQLETFFIRLIRGSSLSGLVGIRARNGNIIHPLLCICKEEILAYLHEKSITYCTDQSNASNDYLRNRIRNTMIPALPLIDHRFVNNAHKTIERLSQADDFIHQHTQAIFKTISHPEELHAIAINDFFQQHPIIQEQLLVLWICKAGVTFSVSSAFLAEIRRFLKNNNPKHTIHQAWYIEKKEGYAHIKTI